MQELLPFQIKRKKRVKEGSTAIEAITAEFTIHYKKHYPDYDINVDELAEAIAMVTSPALLADTSLAWDEKRLSTPLLQLLEIQVENTGKSPLFPRRRYLFLPKPYQKQLKRTYKQLSTLEALATCIDSKKHAKKLIRILHKRLGLYTEKKIKLERPRK